MIISGITSALGISLAKLLVSKKIRVLGFARNIEKTRSILNHPLIELQAADLNDAAAMKSMCSGAYGVFHLAALSSPWGKYSDFFRINVEGTQSLIHAAERANLKRFIYVSTPSVYFNFRDRFNISEEEPLPYKLVNAYAMTKKEGEERVDLACCRGLPCITLRPRALFGPHDQALFPRILKACVQRGIPQFKKQTPFVDITYVDNVAHALWMAMNAPAHCIGEKFNITNGEPLPLADILHMLFDKLSISVKLRQIPYPLAYGCALLSELKSRFTNQEPLLTRYGVGVMSYSQTLCIEKAKQKLGYAPLISITEGINRYVEWFQTH